MKKTNNNKTNKEYIRRKRIINRLVFDLFTFLFLIIIGTLLLNKSLQFESEKIVKYNEKSNLDYKVYLKENDFYDDKYLGKDMIYVASLIDKLLIDFDYSFTSDDNENIEFTYSIIAKLSIENPSGTKAYFEKSYPLLDNKKVSMIDNNSQDIIEQISVNYPYYNTLANSFKNQYGVDADCKLTIFMLINKKNTENSDFILDSSSVMNVVVPLTERAVDISLDYKNIDEVSNIVKKQTMSVRDYLPLVLSGIFIILSLVMMVKAMRNLSLLRKKKSEYDKEISKLLREYDRLIAESSTLMSFENKEIIDIGKFTELLDIHDNLQLPIMYYEVEEHKLSYFYINHENTVYLLKISYEKYNNEN